MGTETFTHVLKEMELGVAPTPKLGKWMLWTCERAKELSQV
jgi:hypothetical protein